MIDSFLAHEERAVSSGPTRVGFAFNQQVPRDRFLVRRGCPTQFGKDVRFFLYESEDKVVKNRVHLDVRVGTGLVGEERLAALEAEYARLAALGGTRVRLLLADDENESCLVMQDIEGNEFCLD